MKIRFLPEVEDYLFELIEILYSKNYFNFHESAIDYVELLIHDIEQNIHLKRKKEAPSHFSRYGKNMFYTTYRKNKNTSWYIFFTIHDDIFLIRYITNNHLSGQYL